MVRFGVLQAVSNASIEVQSGFITGLIGPNGAGKTTLFNVITGLQEPTQGQVVLEGTDITSKSPFRRARLGIARTFQKLEAFSSLSARENVLVAAEQRRAWDKSKFDAGAGGRRDARAGRHRATSPTSWWARCPPAPPASSSWPGPSPSTPRCCCSTRPPRASPRTRPRTWRCCCARLAADGLGILLVEHDMSFVMGTCEYIYVLDFGRIIAQGTPAEVQADPKVQAAYLGALAEPDRGGPRMTAILELRNLRGGYGTIDVLHGVEPHRRARPGARPARPQRRRQDHHPGGLQRADRARRAAS